MTPFETIDMTKYQAAIQHPQTAFADPDLASKTVVYNAMRWPAAQSGNFAIVYRLRGRDRFGKEEVVAVRCFKKLPPDLAFRYKRICEGLDATAAGSKFLLRTRYLQEGIRIDGEWKPITTLPWVEGDPLDRHFDKVHGKRDAMDKVLKQLIALARDLEAASIAHCDLQHRNILVDASGTLRLIDYDGMFVPALTNQRTNELGHPDYQHPHRRDGTIFNAALDRFSLISIYLQTLAISLYPQLWAEKSRTEGLLLRSDDYGDPDGSPTFRALRAHADLREPVDLFRRYCLDDIAELPTLGNFLRDAGLETPREPDRRVRPSPLPADTQAGKPNPPGPIPAAPTLYMPVISPLASRLQKHVGDEVMVIGRYERAEHLRDSSGGLATALFFAGSAFSVLVEGATARQFAALGDQWTVRQGSWLAATGLLVKGGRKYFIEIDQMAQLERLAEPEAMRRRDDRRHRAAAGGRANRSPQSAKPTQSPLGATRPLDRQPVARRDGLPEQGRLRLKDFRQLAEVFDLDRTERER